MKARNPKPKTKRVRKELSHKELGKALAKKRIYDLGATRKVVGMLGHRGLPKAPPGGWLHL